MKVFVVTQGAYSDYHIIAVCIDKNRAQQIARLTSKDLNDSYSRSEIEEYELDEAYGLFPENISNIYRLEYDDAKKLTLLKCENGEDEYNDALSDFVNHSGKKYITYVFANTPEDALKIGADRITQFRAEEQGL